MGNEDFPEDPLSKQLEAYFLKNIIPQASQAARAEAVAAVSEYVEKAQRERLLLQEAISSRLGALDTQLSGLADRTSSLDRIPEDLRAILRDAKDSIDQASAASLKEQDPGGDRVAHFVVGNRDSIIDHQPLFSIERGAGRATKRILDGGGNAGAPGDGHPCIADQEGRKIPARQLIEERVGDH